MMSTTAHIGVLALQGSFAEHLASLNSLSTLFPGLTTSLVRTPLELSHCDALIIPGGESTTMSLVAQSTGLLEPLRDFVSDAKIKTGRNSVWGTCAGMILLCDQVGGVGDDFKGLGGVEAKIIRNQFGRQAASFAHTLELPFLSSPTTPFLATFIRAPVLHSLLSPNPDSIERLAKIPKDLLPKGAGPDGDVVLAKQGGVMISSFHPELGNDARVHEWWVRDVVLGRLAGNN